MNFLPKNYLVNVNLDRPQWYRSSNRDNNLMLLDKNENNDKILQEFHFKNLISLNKDIISTYPDNSYLYTKLADHLGVNPKNLILGPGSDGIIRSAFESFIDINDKVLLTSPTFAMYPIYSKIAQAQVVEIEYISKDERPYLSVDKVISKLKSISVKLFCLPNPDSPTGTIFNPEEIEYLIKVANEVGTIILIDEAYYPFYNETTIDLIKKYDNLIITRTFAKAWGLAGLRTGYGVSSERLINYMHKIKSMYEINTLASEMICKTIDNYSEIENSVDRLNNGKNWFIECLREMNYKVWESHGNFMHVNFSDHAKEIHAKLSNIVLYRKNFEEAALNGFSRFSSTTREEFEVVAKAISEIK